MKARRLPFIYIALLLSACNTTSAERSEIGSISLTGTMQRVWDDGFRLNTGTRALTVDTWNVFGDDTRSRGSVGQRVRVSGERARGAFDAGPAHVL
jgi:hypothetical protein